jgi:hypothetical protein
MSAELEAVGAALYDSRVPASWLAVSYPSLKPLASYVADLVRDSTPLPFLGNLCTSALAGLDLWRCGVRIGVTTSQHAFVFCSIHAWCCKCFAARSSVS